MSYVFKFNQQLRIVLDNPVDANIKSTIRRVIDANHECPLIAFGKCDHCRAYLAMRYGNVIVVDQSNLDFNYQQEYKSCPIVATTVAATIAVSKPTTPSSESVLNVSVADVSQDIIVSLNLPVTDKGYVRTLTPHECAPCTKEHFTPECEEEHLSEHECPPCLEKHLKDHKCQPCNQPHTKDHKCTPCKLAHLSQHKCAPCKLKHLDQHVCQPCSKEHLDAHNCSDYICDRAHLSDHVCPPSAANVEDLQSKISFLQDVVHRYFYQGESPSQAVLSEILSTTTSATPSLSRQVVSRQSRRSSGQSDRPSAGSTPRTSLQTKQPAFGMATSQLIAVPAPAQPINPVRMSSTRNDGEDLHGRSRPGERFPVRPQGRDRSPPSPARSSISNATSHRPTRSNTGVLSAIMQTQPRHKHHRSESKARHSRDSQELATERSRDKR
jgi:hypothetical protein